MKNREKMVETMFETYDFGHVYIQVQAVLTLYAQGLLTGLVVDSGDGVSHAIPVKDAGARSGDVVADAPGGGMPIELACLAAEAEHHVCSVVDE